MPDVVKVEQTKSPVRRETPGLGSFNDFFAPMFPVGRFLGLNPLGFMREFNEEFDKMYRGNGPSMEAWAPAVDIQNCNGNLVVTAELPGLTKNEVKVQMTDDALIIEGERRREHKEDHEGYHRYERSYGKFYRSIPLPETAKADQAKAELNEGVLKISVPVTETKKTRQIPVEQVAEKKTATA